MKTTYEQTKQARGQYINNCEMVSGCWSIKGEDFCKAAGLDYDKAKEAEEEANMQALDDEADEKVMQAANILARDLTEEEMQGIFERTSESFCCDFEGWAFWRNILEQIKEKTESYKNGLSEHLAHSLAERTLDGSRLYKDEWEYNTIADYLGSCEPSEEDAELVDGLGYNLASDFNIQLYWDIETSDGLYRAFSGNTKAEALEQFELFKHDEAGKGAENAKAKNAYIINIEYLNE